MLSTYFMREYKLLNLITQKLFWQLEVNLLSNKVARSGSRTFQKLLLRIFFCRRTKDTEFEFHAILLYGKMLRYRTSKKVIYAYLINILFNNFCRKENYVQRSNINMFKQNYKKNNCYYIRIEHGYFWMKILFAHYINTADI